MTASEEHKAGYAQALNDIQERIANATANGDRTHWDYELVDQLQMLREEQGIPLSEA